MAAATVRPVPTAAPVPPAAPTPEHATPSTVTPPTNNFGTFFTLDSVPEAIVLNGAITDSTPLDFRRAINAEPKATIVVLNSPGGLVESGLILAHEIHDRGLSTYIPKTMGCYSACAYVYFAGTRREADGELGVHQINSDAKDLVSAQTTLSDVLDALNEFGIPQQIISVMLRTPPAVIHVFTRQEIAELGINQGGPILGSARASSPQAAGERPKSEERLLPNSTTNGAAPATRDATKPADGNAVAPAASQSLLLEASQDGTTGAVPFTGTVEWSEGKDEMGQPTLIGNASIPARNLGVSVLIRKNLDPTLPASDLMEINFSVNDSFVGGSIAGLPGVLLKNEELVQGTPLVGASTRVVGNSFLFALSSSPADEATNRDLLTSRRWIDLAIIYATGKKAIITLEKDDRVLIAIEN